MLRQVQINAPVDFQAPGRRFMAEILPKFTKIKHKISQKGEIPKGGRLVGVSAAHFVINTSFGHFWIVLSFLRVKHAILICTSSFFFLIF